MFRQQKMQTHALAHAYAQRQTNTGKEKKTEVRKNKRF